MTGAWSTLVASLLRVPQVPILGPGKARTWAEPVAPSCARILRKGWQRAAPRPKSPGCPGSPGSPASDFCSLGWRSRFWDPGKRRFWLLLSALSPLFAAAQGTTLHVDVKLVSVFVTVTDHNGAIVGGLKKDDFAVFEDGRPQQIAVFERESEMPLALTLAIDTSGSVAKDMSQEAAAARRFVHAILRPQDQMSVLQFATTVRQLTSFTNKEPQIDHALSEMRGDWATALYDAIYQGSDALGAKEGRKVLVVVSDGDDTVQSTTYAQALAEALRNEVMIYSIIDVPIPSDAGRDTGGEHALITLAEQTGGKYFYVDQGGLDKAFDQVSDDLRTQYLLGYYPQHQVPGTDFHRLNVTIPRAAPDVYNLRHKTGYYADPVENN